MPVAIHSPDAPCNSPARSTSNHPPGFQSLGGRCGGPLLFLSAPPMPSPHYTGSAIAPGDFFLLKPARLTAAALLAATAALAQTHTAPARDVDWPAYNGGVSGDHYSPLPQINRANVSQLKQAWRYDTGEKGGLQTNPLIIGDTLYAYTPSGKVIALD